MGKAKRILALCLVLVLAGIVFAQDVKIISRVQNVGRIVRAWNSIPPQTQEWNQAMSKADLLLHARFTTHLVDLNEERRQKLEDERRRACVGYYKQARESLIKQLEAVNELIEEEDY